MMRAWASSSWYCTVIQLWPPDMPTSANLLAIERYRYPE